jgi:uncharacterized protein YjbI with pentapeptide repeats
LSGYTGSILRWESSTDNGINWTTINNTGTTQAFTNLNQTTQYRAVIGGCATVFSTIATVTVNQATIGGTLAGSTTVCSGTNSGSLTLSGHIGTIVRWQRSTNGGNTWQNVNNTTATLNYSNLSQTTMYRVQLSGCNSAFSTTATVTVAPATVGGTVNGSTTVCTGSNSGNLTLSGHSGTILRWESSINNGSTWSTISNTTTTQPYLNLTQTTQFRAVIGGCATVFSSVATVTVNVVAVGGTISGSTTVCAGSNSGTLTLSGQAGNILRWQQSVNGGSSWSNVNNTTTTLNYSNLTQTTMYRAVLSGCNQVNSATATVTVTPGSVGGTIAGSTTVCGGSNSGTMTLSGYTGSVIRWEFSTNNGSTWNTISNTTTTQSFTNLTQTRIYRAMVKNGDCPAVFSSNATITVNPAAVGGTLSGSATVCSTPNATTLTLTGYSGTIVQWQFSTDGGKSWDHIHNQNGSDFTGTSRTIRNRTVTTQYRVLISGCNGQTYSTTAVITVNCGSQSQASSSAGSQSAQPETVTITNVRVMPNPSTSYFNLLIESSSEAKADVKVYDVQGRLWEKFVATPGSTVRFGNNLREGAYFVEVRQGSSVKTTKIIKL